MKKIFVFLMMSFFVTSCGVQEVKEVIKKEEVTIDYNVSSDSISFTSNSDGEYKLYLNQEEVDSGKIEDENTITDLMSDTTYNLVIEDKNETIKTDKVTIMRFGGDVMMTSYFKMYIDSKGVDYMWEDVSELIKSADYSLFNLETSVSLRGSDTKPEGFGFRSEPSTLEGLVNAGIDMVSIANNHVIDYGREALTDTMSSLKEYNIEYIGAGENYNEASKINYQNINGLKVAFIGTTEILGYKSWVAEDEKSGVFYLNKNNLEEINNIIKVAKENSDYVVVVAHWDREYYDYPESETIDMAHTFIDNGADIIIGHHPHVLQGIEYYKEGIIYYSTGNFNFLIKNENASQSALFEVGFDKEKIVSSKVYPIKINACKANLLEKDSKNYNTIIDNLNKRSEQFGTCIDIDGNILKKV